MAFGFYHRHCFAKQREDFFLLCLQHVLFKEGNNDLGEVTDATHFIFRVRVPIVPFVCEVINTSASKGLLDPFENVLVIGAKFDLKETANFYATTKPTMYCGSSRGTISLVLPRFARVLRPLLTSNILLGMDFVCALIQCLL